MENSVVAAALHFENGIAPSEYDNVFDTFHRLNERLRSFPDGTVDLRLNVKERGQSSQHTTLLANIAGHTPMVATSSSANLQQALAEVSDELVRQITDNKNKSEPRHNREMRESL
jgi:ribosome-associated translation inhibitor RaiA